LFRLLKTRLQKFAGLGWPQRWLILEALLSIAIARLMLALTPFSWIAPRLGQERAESGVSLPSEQIALARQIGWAVEAVTRRVAWRNKCLSQAIAAQMLLKRRNIPYTLYLGVAKDEHKDLAAHAWLRCGPAIITGRLGYQRFTVVSTFAA
jgi:hypothetical protein